MPENIKVFESLLERATEFGKTSYHLAKLKSVDKISTIVSVFVVSAICFSFLITFLLFANLGLAFWIGDILGNLYNGFFIVGGFYFVFGGLAYLFFYKKIQKSIRNYIINQFLN